jgi:hypothetical protein
MTPRTGLEPASHSRLITCRSLYNSRRQRKQDHAPQAADPRVQQRPQFIRPHRIGKDDGHCASGPASEGLARIGPLKVITPRDQCR